MKKYVKPEMVCRSTKLTNYIINCSKCGCTTHGSHLQCNSSCCEDENCGTNPAPTRISNDIWGDDNSTGSTGTLF